METSGSTTELAAPVIEATPTLFRGTVLLGGGETTRGSRSVDTLPMNRAGTVRHVVQRKGQRRWRKGDETALLSLLTNDADGKIVPVAAARLLLPQRGGVVAVVEEGVMEHGRKHGCDGLVLFCLLKGLG